MKRARTETVVANHGHREVFSLTDGYTTFAITPGWRSYQLYPSTQSIRPLTTTKPNPLMSTTARIRISNLGSSLTAILSSIHQFTNCACCKGISRRGTRPEINWTKRKRTKKRQCRTTLELTTRLVKIPPSSCLLAQLHTSIHF